MRILSATLLAAQKSATRTPYLKVEIRQRIGNVTRLDFQRIYQGSEADYLHAVTSPGDGSLIRARIDPNSSPKKLYRQRVTNPGQGSDFSQWTEIDDTSPAGTALASYGVNVIHFWADTDQRTILYQESSNYGATWGSIQTLLIATNYVYHLAASMKPNGDVCLFYFEWDTTKAIKREGGTWGSPQTWTNSLDIVSGIATAYYLDWNLAITGRNVSNQRGVWSCIYGDGGSVPVGSWSVLKDILLSDNTNLDYRRPSLTYDGTIHRLVFIEDYSGGLPEGYYKRPYLSFQTPQSAYLDNLCREPYPFNLTLSSQYDSLAIAKSPTKVFLSNAYGVWQATLSPTPLDLTPNVLQLSQHIHPIGTSLASSRMQVELDNSQGQYANFAKKGGELLVSPGYRTTAGEEYSSGPSFWIEGWEYLSQPAKSSILIHTTDAWGLLSAVTLRHQTTWAKDTKTVKEILIHILARAGLPLSVQSQSSLITSFKPAFTIHPGESLATAAKRLLQMVPDVLLFREATAYLKNPQESDNTDYSYGTGHPIFEGRYRENAWEANRVQVWGTETPHIMVDRFHWDELEDFYDRLCQVHDLNINTVPLAEQRADALLRRAEIAATDGEVSIPMNCGQELWDIIEITDPRVNFQARKYRLRALGIEFSIPKPEYLLRIHLGAL